MVAFDSTILSLLLFPDAEVHHGKESKAVEHARGRVLGLVRELEEAKEQILVPTPSLAEVLVTEGADVQDVLTTLRGSSWIRVGDFDERAALELAMRLRAAIKAGDPREGLRITKSAMKFDRQIVAIALVSGARVLYSDDDGVATFAANCGLAVKRVADLPVPFSQGSLQLEQPDSDVTP
ncbi:MAG: type II toxin-antitoxin system VapC family toxin [Acidobacteria bacterium]|nr:type II toxin-antitoxin system VapC family toxin [Acidobacteriota bacterium]